MKFLIVDDHPLFRDALENVLRGLDEQAHCLGAGDCDQAKVHIEQEPELDLLLLDLVVPCPEGTGVDFLTWVTENHPDLPVVMLSASEDPKHMRQALDRGALGYIPKSLPTKVMATALQLVLAGGIYVPPHLVAAGTGGTPRGEAGADAPSPLEVLTPRQREVANLLLGGKSNKEIGRTLGLSPETVKVHIAAIFRTLGVSNRTLAVMELERLGWSGHGDGERDAG